MQGKLQSFIIKSKVFAEKWYLQKNNSLSWSNKNRYLLSKKWFKIYKTRLASWWPCRWNITERSRSKKNTERMARLKEIFFNHLHLLKNLRWLGINQKNLSNHQIKNTLTHVICKLSREYGTYVFKNTKKMQQGIWVRRKLSRRLKRKRRKLLACHKRHLYSRGKRLIKPREMILC